jgi:CRP-like cAMP-binding protein
VPRRVAFVLHGLFSQYYITDSGDTVIKHFFDEGRFSGLVPATLTKAGSLFTIVALEDSTVLQYNFMEFRRLVFRALI